MKLTGTACFFWNLIFLHALAFHVDKGSADAVDGRHAAVYDRLYIQEPCGDRVITPGLGGWSRYGFIQATPDACIDSNKQCAILVNTTNGYHITMRFQYLAFDCSYSTLQIMGETGPSNFCGYGTPAYSIYSSSNWLRYTLSTSAQLPNCQTGFSFYYTTYHTGDCSAGEFRCAIEEGRCIPNEVVCDAYDNCGDWSDEATAICGQSTDISSEITTLEATSTPSPTSSELTTAAYIPPQPCTRSTAVYMNFEPEVDAYGVQTSMKIIRRGSPKCIVVCQKRCSASIVTSCTEGPCRNDGTCIQLSTGYRCECPLGFTGTNCEQELDCDGVTCANRLTSYGT